MTRMGGASGMRSKSIRIEWDIEKLRRLVRDTLIKGEYRSIKDVALAAGIHPVKLYAILNGYQGMRPDTARQIAAFFGIDVFDLLKDE
jgi:hypothetical protein